MHSVDISFNVSSSLDSFELTFLSSLSGGATGDSRILEKRPTAKGRISIGCSAVFLDKSDCLGVLVCTLSKISSRQASFSVSLSTDVTPLDQSISWLVQTLLFPHRSANNLNRFRVFRRGNVSITCTIGTSVVA